MSTHTDFYESVETYAEPVERHALFLEAYREHRRAVGGGELDVLDVGCGEHAVLRSGIDGRDRYFGVDVKANISAPLEHYASLDLDRDSLAAAWPEQRFDVIFCGEVIEHVFSPDRLLRELASVMHARSLLVLGPRTSPTGSTASFCR